MPIHIFLTFNNADIFTLPLEIQERKTLDNNLTFLKCTKVEFNITLCLSYLLISKIGVKSVQMWSCFTAQITFRFAELQNKNVTV